MLSPLTIDFDQLNWQPHPSIQGIEVKLLQNPMEFSPVDIMIARIVPGGEIPWHVHESNSEIAYVLQGEGTLYCAANKQQDTTTQTAMSAGSAVSIPPGLWHSVRNIGEAELIIFASHTP